MTNREMIDTDNGKRNVRGDDDGKFKKSDFGSSSLSADARREARNGAKSGQGDKSDRKH